MISGEIEEVAFRSKDALLLALDRRASLAGKIKYMVDMSKFQNLFYEREEGRRERRRRGVNKLSA